MLKISAKFLFEALEDIGRILSSKGFVSQWNGHWPALFLEAAFVLFGLNQHWEHWDSTIVRKSFPIFLNLDVQGAGPRFEPGAMQ